MYDLLILGGGPAGLTAAIYAARAGLHFAVLEQDGWGGGQISSAWRVNNYPGLPGISGSELGERIREHAVGLGAELRYGEAAALTRTAEGFLIETAEGDLLPARSVIAAPGSAPRKLGVPGEEKAGVSCCAVCDGEFFAGKAVAVVGGGDTAVDAALYLAGLCPRVTVLLRRDVFRAVKSRAELLKRTESVVIRTGTRVREVLGDGRVEGLRIVSGEREEILPCEGLFLAVGSRPQTGFLRSIPGLLDEDGYLLADETGATAVPGLFAAGDARKKALRQVATAVADGANAATAAAIFLQAGER